MTARFVIMYRGREGSSPLISTLARHPDIHVPLFETLDFYTARNWARADTIAATLDQVLRGEAVRRAGAVVAHAAPAHAAAIGFKWRFWGEPEAVAAVLRAQGCVLFHLFRRDLLDLAASLYFSNTVIPALERDRGVDLAGGGHLQFKLAKLDEPERAALRERLAALRFTIPPDELEAIARRILTDKRGKLDTYAEPARSAGRPIHAVLYEDYCADRIGLSRAIAATIGLDPARQTSFEPSYAKVTGPGFLGQVDNLEELKATQRFRQISRSYERLIHERHQYLPPRPAGRPG